MVSYKANAVMVIQGHNQMAGRPSACPVQMAKITELYGDGMGAQS